ncbi:MAG: YkgJ family cysteine cluster protein [Acidobacteria bacterium]|nr:YkgJ family cysteine cluster protein [Acidobacteriota bacterium]
MPNETPEGFLRFECQRGCIKCCEREGYVYFSEADARQTAKFLGMTLRAFDAKYIYKTRHQRRLRKLSKRQCVFLTPDGCSIHEAKPTQCRLFPFWPGLAGMKREWNRTAKWCPGIGQGPLIQIGTAMEAAAEMYDAYPTFF